jgi:hypothetical protein
MGDATKEDFLTICTCTLVVCAFVAWVAWVGLYRLWKRYVQHKPVSSIFQLIKLLCWLLAVAIVSFCTVYALWFFISFYSVFLFS